MGDKRNKKRAVQNQQRQSGRAAANSILRQARAGPATPPAAEWHRRAIAHWNANRFEEAVAAFLEAHRQAPFDTMVAADCAKALALRYRREEARALFDKLSAAHPADPFPCIRAGEAFVEAQEFATALGYYRRAAEMPHCGAGAWMGLARIAERLHHLDEAEEALTRAESLVPGLPPARVLRAQVCRRRKDLTGAEAYARAEIDAPLQDAESRWRAWYELAAVCDLQGRYDEAFEAATRAKQITGAEAESFRQGNAMAEAESLELMRALTPAHFLRWREPAAHRPLAVLCGYPRSGTTLIEQVLDAHPGLVSADESIVMGDDVVSPLRLTRPLEVPWLTVLDEAPPDMLSRCRDRYFAHTTVFLGEEPGNRILLDKNPALTLALPAVMRVFPAAKCLIALRDPRDVAVSCFLQGVPPNAVSAHWQTLGDTARHLASCLRGWEILRKVLPEDSWREVRYEETTADLPSTAAKSLAFLGLPWDDGVLAFHEHAGRKHVHSPTYAAVTEPVHRRAVGRWRHYERYLEPHLKILQPALEAFDHSP
ncbi:MAG TPA: sulfotransferase [Verrucomicrobiales bacterium]|nr:sulfotransferase [Verrucomicrobiales bacterium]